MKLGLGKVSARNYAAQAELGLVQYAALAVRSGKAADAAGSKFLSSMIGEAVHFAVPDNGMIFNDDLRGLRGMKLELPFERVTLEFFVEYDPKKMTKEQPEHAPKRLILLEKMTRDTVEVLRRELGEMSVGSAVLPPLDDLQGDDFIFFATCCMVRGMWTPMGATFLFQCEDWDGGSGSGFVVLDTRLEQSKDRVWNVRGRIGVLLLDYANALIDEYGPDKGMRALGSDISGELRAAMEFFEAVVCSNVISDVHEPAPPANVAARRARDGKAPIYETKVLTIKLNEREARYAREAEASGRASPREHLRRGHIRRWQNGRTKWILPMMINAGSERGKVHKSYRIGG